MNDLKKIDVHQHQLVYFAQCEFKYWMSQHYQKKVQKHYINAGSMFAHGVYNLHLGVDVAECYGKIDEKADELIFNQTDQKAIDDIRLQSEMVKSMLVGYEERFIISPKSTLTLKQVIPEKRLEVLNGDLKLIARLDGDVIDDTDNHWVMELKTTTQVDRNMVRRLPLDFQSNFYCLMQKYNGIAVKGVIYRWIRKTNLKQKKDETYEQYKDRVLRDYVQRPEFYFVEECPVFDYNAVNRFESSLKLLLSRLKMCIYTDTWNQYYNACKVGFNVCQYMDYCLNPTEETLNTYFKERGTEDVTEIEDEAEAQFI